MPLLPRINWRAATVYNERQLCLGWRLNQYTHRIASSLQSWTTPLPSRASTLQLHRLQHIVEVNRLGIVGSIVALQCHPDDIVRGPGAVNDG